MTHYARTTTSENAVDRLIEGTRMKNAEIQNIAWNAVDADEKGRYHVVYDCEAVQDMRNTDITLYFGIFDFISTQIAQP